MQSNKDLLLVIVLLMVVETSFGQPRAAVRIKDEYTTISSGMRIHYLEAGSGTRLPVLMTTTRK